MQRIKTVRFPTRNIGGDRAYCRLRYCVGQSFGLPVGNISNSQNQVINVGAATPATALALLSLNGIMGNTPNLSTMGALYQQYRIRGIKVKLTYWQTAGEPVMLYTNAQGDQGVLLDTATGPTPAFVAPNVSTVTEQRWSKYRVCQQTQNGGKPTTLSSYYSVNKVQGPDAVVKNDEDYTGNMNVATPYWAAASSSVSRPQRSPWLQFGITTLTGANVTTAVTGVLKVEETVYVEFFGKRPATE